jgi:predicted ester cyclase
MGLLRGQRFLSEARRCHCRYSLAPHAIPDLKWEIKEVLVSNKRVIVRGEASGHPAGIFMGVPHGGRSRH